MTLGFPIGPAAVLRGVIAVVVAAVQRHAVWARRYVGDKLVDVVPPLAYANAAPAVSRVSGAFVVIAAGHHPGPRCVKRMPVEMMFVPAGLNNQRIAVTTKSLVVSLAEPTPTIRLFASIN